MNPILGETSFPTKGPLNLGRAVTPQTLCVYHPSALAAQAYALKEENDSLRWQLDAYRNEVELLKQESRWVFENPCESDAPGS